MGYTVVFLLLSRNSCLLLLHPANKTGAGFSPTSELLLGPYPGGYLFMIDLEMAKMGP